MPWESEITAAAAQWGIPADLALAVASVESSLNPNAVSPRGAIGLFQLMPATAAELGVNNPLDPLQNINGGLCYLRQLYDQFGSWDLALSAYNAGPGMLRRVLAGAARLPAETVHYVSKILAMVGMSTGDGPAAVPAAQEETAHT